MAESAAADELAGGHRRPSPLLDSATESQLREAERQARADAPSPRQAPGSVPLVASPTVTMTDGTRGGAPGVPPVTDVPGDEVEGRDAAAWPLAAQRRHAPRPMAAAAATSAGALPAPPVRQWEATAVVEGHGGTGTPPLTAPLPGGGNDAVATEALEPPHWSVSASERGDDAVPTVMAAGPHAVGADVPSARFAAQMAAAQTLAVGGQPAAAPAPAQDNFWQHLQNFRPPGRAADGRPHHADVTLQQLQAENQRQQQRHQQMMAVSLFA